MEERMAEKLIVLSMDAMVAEDLDHLQTKPNFSRLFAGAARTGSMCTIYPSITYPAHVSIRTGCRPGKHGVYTNYPLNLTGAPPAWHLQSTAVQVEDLFDAAKRAGKTTASVYWPVTACHPHIDYNINEFFFYRKEPIEPTFAAMGTNEATMAVIRENMDRFPDLDHLFRDLTLRDTFDHFITGCMCSLIRRYQPDVLLAHNCHMDTIRHRYGVFNAHTTACLDQLDVWLGELIAAMEDAGVYDKTNFVLLSDHGQRHFSYEAKPNVLLRQAGYIDVDDAGCVTDWRAICQSNGMSAYVFVKNDADRPAVESLLRAWSDAGTYGIGTVRTVDQTRETYGLYGDFAFLLETDGRSGFDNGWTGPAVDHFAPGDAREDAATHGYEPETGPQPVFIARGGAFRPGAYLEAARVIDEAPTLAHILGADMPQAEGRILTELLA